MVDSFNAPDAYHIHFSRSDWYPTVFRGDPVYTNYWITDNHRGGIVLYVNSDFNGYHLTDYYSLTDTFDVTAEYFPGQEPTTALEIRNSPPGSCGLNRALYGQTSAFYVQ